MPEPGKRRRIHCYAGIRQRLLGRMPAMPRAEDAPVGKPEEPSVKHLTFKEILQKVMDANPPDLESTRARLREYGLADDEVTMGTVAAVHCGIKAVNGDTKSLKLILDEEQRRLMLQLSYDQLNHKKAIDWARLDHMKEKDEKQYALAYERLHQQDPQNNREAIELQLQSIADRLNHPLPVRTLADVEAADGDETEPEENTGGEAFS